MYITVKTGCSKKRPIYDFRYYSLFKIALLSSDVLVNKAGMYNSIYIYYTN